MEWLKVRLVYWTDLLKKQIWPWVVIPLNFLGFLPLVRDNVLSPELATKLKMPAWLPAIPWYCWIISALVMALAAVLEGAYREHAVLFSKFNSTVNRSLELIFDEGDSRCVRNRRLRLYDGIASTHWYIGMRNASMHKSVDEISLIAHKNQFVDCTISLAHLRGLGLPRGNPVIEKLDTLPPGAEEFIELFGLSATDKWSENDILSKKQTFTLEARARDTPAALAVLEYDPTTRPATIRRIS
jgi:hypothetical protein